MQNYMIFDSKLGKMYISADNSGINGIWFWKQKFFPSPQQLGVECNENPILREAKRKIELYFDGKIQQFDIPIHVNGTDFQRLIWEILQTIPYGKTLTYGQIAKIAAQKMQIDTMSAQAVGNAVGRNPVSIMIPCHRVIGANGSLTGYAGGIDRKSALLALEAGIAIPDNEKWIIP